MISYWNFRTFIASFIRFFSPLIQRAYSSLKISSTKKLAKDLNIPPEMIYKWKTSIIRICSISQFSCSVVSDSLQPHDSQHARPPCPLPTPGVYSNSCPLSQWWIVIFSKSFFYVFKYCYMCICGDVWFTATQLS